MFSVSSSKNLRYSILLLKLIAASRRLQFIHQNDQTAPDLLPLVREAKSPRHPANVDGATPASIPTTTTPIKATKEEVHSARLTTTTTAAILPKVVDPTCQKPWSLSKKTSSLAQLPTAPSSSSQPEIHPSSLGRRRYRAQKTRQEGCLSIFIRSEQPGKLIENTALS